MDLSNSPESVRIRLHPGSSSRCGKHFSSHVSSKHDTKCCFPIPHRAFSQLEIDSSGSQRESGRSEKNTVADTKAICAFKSRDFSREVTALSAVFGGRDFEGIEAKLEEWKHHLRRQRTFFRTQKHLKQHNNS